MYVRIIYESHENALKPFLAQFFINGSIYSTPKSIHTYFVCIAVKKSISRKTLLNLFFIKYLILDPLSK